MDPSAKNRFELFVVQRKHLPHNSLDLVREGLRLSNRDARSQLARLRTSRKRLVNNFGFGPSPHLLLGERNLHRTAERRHPHESTLANQHFDLFLSEWQLHAHGCVRLMGNRSRREGLWAVWV
jgi:hypothetical protein